LYPGHWSLMCTVYGLGWGWGATWLYIPQINLATISVLVRQLHFISTPISTSLEIFLVTYNDYALNKEFLYFHKNMTRVHSGECGEIWGYQRSVTEDLCILGCYTMSTGKYLLMFSGIIVPSSSESNSPRWVKSTSLHNIS